MATPSRQPDLVVIEAKAKTYSRYHGKTCTHFVMSEEPLMASEVERFRTNPELFTYTDPEVA